MPKGQQGLGWQLEDLACRIYGDGSLNMADGWVANVSEYMNKTDHEYMIERVRKANPRGKLQSPNLATCARFYFLLQNTPAEEEVGCS